MSKQTTQRGTVLVLAMLIVGGASGAESPGGPSEATATSRLDHQVSQPVDIAPWAYAWRADRAVQERPEACFIPRRLERMDKVDRTTFSAMHEQERKSLYYQMPELLGLGSIGR